ncbi:MAG: hypothetical protein IIB15_06120, partial [Chloroflexi bacterium]|nr:hypothetical protein [Chloroflexota bacterium]
PESARFRLFDSIATFLKNLSRTEPLVLMLEDLHWADKPSLMLLEFVARELANSKILIVGNYRDVELNRRHPLSVTLGDLSRERLFERVVLRGLQRHDVARFIEIAAGITPPDALVNTVHSQTEGNPLFVTETVRLLIQEGVISAGQQSKGGTTSWEIRIPEGVREVIGRRLDRLSERCNELLTIAAVVGRQFHFDVLKALVEDTTDGQLLDAMDEALSARIIEEIPTEVGLYQFSHASMQETLTGELSLTRRVTVHARVAEALEKLYADDLAAHAETLAYHFEQAQTIHGAEKMVQYSIIAGQAALNALGYDEALLHFNRAYEARKNDQMDEELAEILFGLGRAETSALTGSEDQNRGLGRFVQAFDFYRAVGDKERAAEISSVPFLAIFADNAVVLTDRALEYLDPESPGAAESWSRKGLILAFTKGEIEEALAATQRGIDIAQRHGMAGAEAWGHDHRELIQMESGNFDEAIKSGEAGVAAAQRAGDQRAAFLAHHFLFLSNAFIGNKDIAEHHFNLGIEMARQSRDKVRILQANSMGMGFRLVTGEYEHQVYDIEVDVKDGMGLPSLSYKAWSALEQGKDEEAQALFEQIKNEALRRLEQGIPAIGPAWIMAAIVGLGIRSQVDLDKAGYDLILSSLYGEHFTASMPYSRSGVAAAWAIQQEDIDHAPERYSALIPYRGRVVGWISSDTLLGLLSVLMGDINQASGHFEDAIQFCQNAGYRPEVAWAQFHYAETLIGANRQPEKVAELQDSALAIANELGMKLLTRRVLAQLDILKA